MLYNLYSIYDKDAKEYGPLFNAKNNLVASRFVEDMMKGVKCIDSFDLYFMGEYDTEHGIVNTKVEYVSDCSDLVEPFEDGE